MLSLKLLTHARFYLSFFRSCARKNYYQSRKELLAQRYLENREERLAKQKEYYRLKKLRASTGESETKPATRGRKKKTNAASSFEQQNVCF